MSNSGKILVGIALAASGLIVSSCTLKTLKDDLDVARAEYGYTKGEISGTEDGSDTLVALYKNEPEGMSIVQVRSPSPGDPFFFLVPTGDYTLLAFSDTNGDYSYQSGEPAAYFDESENMPTYVLDAHDGSDAVPGWVQGKF